MKFPICVLKDQTNSFNTKIRKLHLKIANHKQKIIDNELNFFWSNNPVYLKFYQSNFFIKYSQNPSTNMISMKRTLKETVLNKFNLLLHIYSKMDL